MIRAGVFIGVDRTGGLQPLHDAAAGAVSMREWALHQGMRPEDAVLITDQDGVTVTPDEIYAAVKAVVDGPGVDQLLIYFAGHGVNLNRGEQWLLTEAPVRASAAVDVRTSVETARYSGIPHVVVVSDACRVAPEGIQAQNVRGDVIFPNDATGDRARPVDQFFACLLGRTAAEIKDPATAANGYSALYTHTLLDALWGRAPAVVESLDPAGPPRYVRPRRLQSWLEAEVPARVLARGLQNRVNQNPDAIITSDGAWLAEVEEGAGEPVDREVGPPAPPGRDDASWSGALSRMTSVALEGAADLGDARAGMGASPVGREMLRTADEVAQPFEHDHLETQCGVQVRGAVVVDAVVGRGERELLAPGLVRIAPTEGPTSVVLTLDGGTGTVVPALPGYVTGLTVADGELVDVAYEPSSNSDAWPEYRDRAAELRFLRGVAASASAHGRFRLEGEQAAALAQRMQLGKGLDPTLAVYAAYAYHDLQDLDRLAEMSEHLRAALDVGLFDVELLAAHLVDARVSPDTPVIPSVPLLAQGWAVVRAHRVRLPGGLGALEGHLVDSVWSLYDAAGVEVLREAVARGEMR